MCFTRGLSHVLQALAEKLFLLSPWTTSTRFSILEATLSLKEQIHGNTDSHKQISRPVRRQEKAFPGALAYYRPRGKASNSRHVCILACHRDPSALCTAYQSSPPDTRKLVRSGSATSAVCALQSCL